MTIETPPISSSNIAAVSYDTDTQALTVTFVSGGKYEYLDVPQETFDGLVGAGSVGSYFHEVIKTAYSAVKVG